MLIKSNHFSLNQRQSKISFFQQKPSGRYFVKKLLLFLSKANIFGGEKSRHDLSI